MAANRKKQNSAWLTKGQVWAVVIVGGLVVIFTGVVTFINIAFSGGYDQWKQSHQPKPDFNSAYFKGLRANTQKQLDAVFTDIPSSTFQQVSSKTSNSCQPGIRNWVNHDSYVYQCFMSETRIYGFNGDFVATVSALDTTLTSAGWYGSVDDIPQVLSGYYTPLYHGPSGGYSLAEMPSATYGKDTQAMGLRWAERGDEVANSAEFGDQKDAKAIMTQAFGSDQYVMQVITNKTYYQK